MIEINGKVYPLWSQFVEKKDQWIGGVLQDFGDNMDRTTGIAGAEGVVTKITDVILEPNGDKSAWFEITGEKFNCGFDVRHGGISGRQEKGWLTISGYGGHKFRIKGPENENKEK